MADDVSGNHDTIIYKDEEYKAAVTVEKHEERFCPTEFESVTPYENERMINLRAYT